MSLSPSFKDFCCSLKQSIPFSYETLDVSCDSRDYQSSFYLPFYGHFFCVIFSSCLIWKCDTSVFTPAFCYFINVIIWYKIFRSSFIFSQYVYLCNVIMLGLKKTNQGFRLTSVKTISWSECSGKVSTGSAYGAGSAYPSAAAEITPSFCWDSCFFVFKLVFYVVLCTIILSVFLFSHDVVSLFSIYEFKCPSAIFLPSFSTIIKLSG